MATLLVECLMINACAKYRGSLAIQREEGGGRRAGSDSSPLKGHTSHGHDLMQALSHFSITEVALHQLRGEEGGGRREDQVLLPKAF